MFAYLRNRLRLTDLEGGLVTPHTLRRTFASTMYEAGAPWEVCARALGHGEDVTALYARISWDRLEKAVGNVRYWDGVPRQLEFML